MGWRIYCLPQFSKCLEKLQKAGGRALLAVERIETILTKMATEEGLLPTTVNKLTKHGEARIDGCQKFDLGRGYRLVYVKEREHYCFLFAGTHDDCDRWLNHNKSIYIEVQKAVSLSLEKASDTTDESFIVQESGEGSDYDDMLMQRIDEKVLRAVFRGLCGE